MDQIKIGPLTGDEWASFALGADDERNPLPPCCANLSEARDVLFDVMRVGGDVEVCWPMMVEVWPVIESHTGDESARRDDPVLSKLYETYVKGREDLAQERRPQHDAAMARIMAKEPDQVHQFITMIEAPDGWNIDTRQGQLDAIAAVGGRQVALVLDPDERFRCAQHLAEVLGANLPELCTMIDVLRMFTRLPYEPTNPDDRDA